MPAPPQRPNAALGAGSKLAVVVWMGVGGHIVWCGWLQADTDGQVSEHTPMWMEAGKCFWVRVDIAQCAVDA